MDDVEFKAICHLLFGDAHSWGAEEAANWLDVNPRTVRRWAAGEMPVPAGVQALLRKEIAWDLVRGAYRLEAPFFKVINDALKALEEKRFVLTADDQGKTHLVASGTVPA